MSLIGDILEKAMAEAGRAMTRRDCRRPGRDARFRPMNAHRLAEERSVAYHRHVAARMRQDPKVLEQARRRVRAWLDNLDPIPRYARRWHEILAGDVGSIAAFLEQRNDEADELRQSSPFAGVLDARERWHIWRETKQPSTALP